MLLVRGKYGDCCWGVKLK